MNQTIKQANQFREQVDGFIDHFSEEIDKWISSGDTEDFSDNVTRHDDEPALFNRIALAVQSELSKLYSDYEVQVVITAPHGNLNVNVSRRDY
nr:hypothetical protein [uncultured Pseudomonas sp.]